MPSKEINRHTVTSDMVPKRRRGRRLQSNGKLTLIDPNGIQRAADQRRQQLRAEKQKMQEVVNYHLSTTKQGRRTAKRTVSHIFNTQHDVGPSDEQDVYHQAESDVYHQAESDKQHSHSDAGLGDAGTAEVHSSEAAAEGLREVDEPADEDTTKRRRDGAVRQSSTCSVHSPHQSQARMGSWLSLRPVFLDELLRHDGLSDRLDNRRCDRCDKTGQAADHYFRCLDCCADRLLCQQCMVEDHVRLALHRIEVCWAPSCYLRQL